MNINILAMGLMAMVIGLYSWRAYLHQDDPAPSQLPWVPIDVNKHRSFTSMTRDAGMYIERVRRQAIIGNPYVFSYKDSTNGYLEAGLTGICVCAPRAVCPAAPNVVWSDGVADEEICDTVDAGGALGMYDTIDFGGADANACDV